MTNSLKIKIYSGNESYDLDFNNLNTQNNVQIEITLPAPIAETAGDPAHEPRRETMDEPTHEPRREPVGDPAHEPRRETVGDPRRGPAPVIVEIATSINRRAREPARPGIYTESPFSDTYNDSETESNNSSEVEEPLHPIRIPFEQETEDSATSFGSRVFRAGDADRPPIVFDAYISRLPMIEMLQTTRAEHVDMYKEFITKFDAWIRRVMRSEIISRARLAIEIDKYFYEYLLKFPFMLPEWTFNVFIELLSEDEPNETPEMIDDRNKMKNILLAIVDGFMYDIVYLFDVPECHCNRCSTF